MRSTGVWSIYLNPSLSAQKWLTDNCEPLFNFSVTKNVTKIVAIATFHSKKMQVESGDIFITRYSLTLGLTHNKLMKEGVPHDFYIRPGGHKWSYWSNSIKYQMLFFSNCFSKVK